MKPRVLTPAAAAHEFRVQSVGMQGVGWLYHNPEEGYRFFLVPKGEMPPMQMETVFCPPIDRFAPLDPNPTDCTFTRSVWRPVHPPQTLELP
jgi:hypothetical protein